MGNGPFSPGGPSESAGGPELTHDHGLLGLSTAHWIEGGVATAAIAAAATAFLALHHKKKDAPPKEQEDVLVHAKVIAATKDTLRTQEVTSPVATLSR